MYVRPVLLLLMPIDLIHSVSENETLKRLQHVTKPHYKTQTVNPKN